jgi:hypothetical protein
MNCRQVKGRDQCAVDFKSVEHDKRSNARRRADGNSAPCLRRTKTETNAVPDHFWRAEVRII